MNNIWIVVIIFTLSILVALMISAVLDWQDKKEDEMKEQKKEASKKTSKIIPDSSILDNSKENNIKKLLENFTNNENNKLIPIGWDEKQEVKSIDFNKNNHLLIIGTTGGGKSICLNEIITSIIMNHSAEDIKMVTMDTSMVELSSFNGIPHYIKDTIISPNEVMDELRELEKEIRRRTKDSQMTNLFVIIDDLYDICSYDSKVLRTIEQLLKDNKEKNIHFIIATDTPTKEIITDDMKKQIDGTIYLTLAPGEKNDFDLDITKADMEFIAEIGSAIYKTPEKKEKIIIPEVLEEEIKAIKNCYSKYH